MDLELECLVDFIGTAAWRQRVAEEHPEDVRNLQAAEMLERLGVEAKALEGSQLHKDLYAKWLREDLEDGSELPFNEKIGESLRSIGFGYHPHGAANFLQHLLQL